ncbi:MAG: glucosaminidase domain-containing protein [Treponema sp.]|jgi:hypothetical protein|nr:glucosaminidase domain-containing protein [Treponema sp.]
MGFIQFLISIATLVLLIPTQTAEEVVVPPSPQAIMGSGLIPADYMALFLMKEHPVLSPQFSTAFAAMYVEEAAYEGVNHDIAFAQMCLETGFLRFGGLVKPYMNNFGGLGAISAQQPGERFPDIRTGIRAQIQHLKGYATQDDLVQPLVDPRYRWIRRGVAPTIAELAGTWATDRLYATKITNILKRMYEYAYSIRTKTHTVKSAVQDF